ncbi:hypothetical protein CDAR_370741 [Caerostris darwini]|uniref:Uncharacterized protein n=1 Tax=Caerostris darwini TaxID=1538125 RepID=A0AAV4VGW0_9ARAC|nr:hypothetical protein CDAR_370741 [Caerostris darwini]
MVNTISQYIHFYNLPPKLIASTLFPRIKKAEKLFPAHEPANKALIPHRLSLISIIRKEYLRMRKERATCNDNLHTPPSTFQKQQAAKRALSRSIGISPSLRGADLWKNWG